jgi:hypothetical protein
MSSERNLAVIHFRKEESEQVLKVRNRIGSALARGRNVVLVCEGPMLRRMERMTFACLGVHQVPGRFAVVTEDVEQFSEAIPPVLANRLQVFSSQREAFDWADPNPIDVNATLQLLGS